MKRKIIFFLPLMGGGGAERVTVNILRKLDREQFDIYLLLVSKQGILLNLIPKYVNIIDLNTKKTIFSILKLRNIINKIQPDIIYSTLLHTHIVLDLALTFQKNRPNLILRSPTSPRNLLLRGELNSIIKFFIEKAYKNSYKILAQTPEMREEISYYHNIDINKIDIFLNPLDFKLIDKKTKNSLNPFDKNMINIVASGTLYNVKGFDILLYSFKKVINKNSNFFLHILGRDGGEKNNLERVVKKLSIQDKVKFWKFQENPYIFYKHCDLFVLSSRREGLPNTVLENLYLKKPIVATRCISFLEELIKDGQNGFLVDVDNIEQLANAILNFKKLQGNKGFLNNQYNKKVDIFKIFEIKKERDNDEQYKNR